ncbi:hypothetical protein GUJ93_ZPchr0008g13583 [Zizania palustris]|uniref:Uncharacterized protein n=1 Tax=Zizania palustris TaxID=103762 RepID=A0A8J5UVV2_ZIZPA|nr:hypothetical protein GUJ93_ZPchr0008g13583 [Zizania palustris]
MRSSQSTDSRSGPFIPFSGASSSPEPPAGEDSASLSSSAVVATTDRRSRLAAGAGGHARAAGAGRQGRARRSVERTEPLGRGSRDLRCWKPSAEEDYRHWEPLTREDCLCRMMADARGNRRRRSGTIDAGKDRPATREGNGGVEVWRCLGAVESSSPLRTRRYPCPRAISELGRSIRSVAITA